MPLTKWGPWVPQDLPSYRGSVKCRMWTIVFSIGKQWDCCCHILICMVETIVRSLRFTLTALATPLPSTESLNPSHIPLDFPNIFAKHKQIKGLLICAMTQTNQ